MVQLSIFLFGPPRIERDGVPVSIDTRKAMALIAYLAITQQRHSRDALASLLWPDYEQTRARATLRRTLSVLNKALAGTCLDIDRETVSLRQDGEHWIDVYEFQQCLQHCRAHAHPLDEPCSQCLSLLSRAAELYRDDFMAGFTLHDSDNFDNWQFFQADSMRRDLASVLERLVTAYTGRTDFATAITYARRWLTIDRLHEPAYRQLMLLYSWSGQRAAAMHQYQECVAVLEKELGVAPLGTTTELYTAIKENTLPAPILTTEVTTSQQAITPLYNEDIAPAELTTYPLVGRRDELVALFTAYLASSVTGRVIVLEGEAGIGKTRLAEEFVAQVKQTGATVLSTRCYEGETNLAYGPIVAGLRDVLRQKQGTAWQAHLPTHWIAEAARLLPELQTHLSDAPSLSAPDSPGAQVRFFEGLRQVVLSICGGEKTGLLFIDDSHWADSASLDLLSYLIRRLDEHPLCLLLTRRSSQTHQRMQLQALLAEAQRAGKVTILSLARLQPETVETLIHTLDLPKNPSSKQLIQRLYQETEGLPLFLTEYLTAIARGTLLLDEEQWKLPGGVRDLLISRINMISDTSRQILSTAAVIGRSFDFDTLRDVSGRSEEETISALEELIEQGLVTELSSRTSKTGSLDFNEEPATSFDFNHEKLRTLVYEETGQLRRHLLHRRMAELLVTRARGQRAPGEQTGNIAYHFHRAGKLATAAEYYVQAGEYAATLYAHSMALAHFQAAQSLQFPDHTRLYEAMGDAQTFLGEYGQALKHYQQAASSASGQAQARLRHKTGIIYERRGEWQQAEQAYESALEAARENTSQNDWPQDLVEQARIYADWSLVAYRRNAYLQATRLAEQSLALAQQTEDIRALAQAHNILGIIASRQAACEMAIYHLQQSLALAETHNEPGAKAAALNNLSLIYKAQGAFEQATVLAQEALALCIAQGDRHREAALHSNLADLLHETGQLEASMAHLKQAVSIYAEIGVEAGTVQAGIWKLTSW